MINIFLLANTFSKSKNIILSYPKINHKGLLSYEALAEVFLSERKTNHIQDVVIGDYRYISYPHQINSKKYFSSKMLQTDEEQNAQLEELRQMEKKKKFIKPKYFTIVLVFYKSYKEIHKILNSVYYSIEKFSNLLLLEEYRALFLAHEIQNIYILLENIEKDEKDDQSLSPQLRGKQDKKKESTCLVLNNDYNSSMLYKNIKQLYEDYTNKTYITKININNMQEFRFPLKLKRLFFTNIQPNDALIIFKKQSIIQTIFQSMDINPIYYLIISQSNSFKSIFELALEYNVDFTYLCYLSNQICIWGLGQIMKKLSSSTILFPMSELKYVPSKLENYFENEYGQNLYSVLQKLINRHKLNTLYKKYFNSMSSQKFMSMIDCLIENQLVVQCSKFILPRYNSLLLTKSNEEHKEHKENSYFSIVKSNQTNHITEEHLLHKGCQRNESHSSILETSDPELLIIKKSQIAFKSNEKYSKILNDYSSYNDLLSRSIEVSNNHNLSCETSETMIKNKNFTKKNMSFIDILCLMSQSDGEIFKNIKLFLTKDFNYEDLIYITGYSDEILSGFIEKYYYFFHVITVVDSN